MVLLYSGLHKLQTQLRGHLIEIIEEYLRSLDIKIALKECLEVAKDLECLNAVVLESKGTKGLETMIKIASKYIQQFGINNPSSRLLAGFVVQIAGELEAAVPKIKSSEEVLYETKAGLLKRLILLIVKLISNVDSKLRGRKLVRKDIDYPNNAFLRVLEKAAYALVDEAKKLNDPRELIRELINTIFVLFEITKGLRSDEIWPIYDEILIIISIFIENDKGIDNNLREQFNKIKNQDINNNSIEQLRRIFHQLADQYR